MLTKLSQNKTLPKWSFPGRRPASAGARIMPTPGPGSYAGATNTQHRSVPSYGFGSSTRNTETGDAGLKRSTSTPGPGQYTQVDRPQSAAARYGFGTERRKTQGGAHEDASVANTPGPGSYAPCWETTRNKAPRFSTTPRRDIGRTRCSTPGPGSYKPNGRPESVGGPVWVFGTSKRDRGRNGSNPGPGSYPVKDGFGDSTHAPKYTMRMRTGHSLSAPNLRDALSHSHIGGQVTQFGY